MWEACCGPRADEPCWGGPVEEGAWPGFAAAPPSSISCQFQESSVEMNLIFLQMRKGALREEKPGWALTFNFQAL